MEKRHLYQQPYAYDLSGMTVLGGKPKPMGTCVNGSIIRVSACSGGPLVNPLPSHCEVGVRPETPQCDSGTSGSFGCVSGGTP